MVSAYRAPSSHRIDTIEPVSPRAAISAAMRAQAHTLVPVEPPQRRPRRALTSWAAAIEAACAKEGISVFDLDLVEINEAFAAVAVASIKRLGIDDSRLNVNGGAIALGHPIGMSGARLVLHLMYELRRRGGGIGAAALCGGGGQGDALIVEVPAAT